MDIEKTIITRMVNNERKKIGPMLAENRKIRGGNIKKRKKGSKFYYTEYIKGKEHGITNDLERVHLLYRKKYLRYSITKSKTIIKHLEHLLEELEKLESHSDSMNFGVYSIDEWQWIKATYETNPLYQERLQHRTLLGTMVRSKSELNIANVLERLGIPYRYEQKTYVDGNILYPDFTLLLPNLNLLVWEHNGLMEDETYAARSYIKTMEYEKAGYRQHNNLIVTYEDDIRTPEQIERIVERYYIL